MTRGSNGTEMKHRKTVSDKNTYFSCLLPASLCPPCPLPMLTSPTMQPLLHSFSSGSYQPLPFPCPCRLREHYLPAVARLWENSSCLVVPFNSSHTHVHSSSNSFFLPHPPPSALLPNSFLPSPLPPLPPLSFLLSTSFWFFLQLILVYRVLCLPWAPD